MIKQIIKNKENNCFKAITYYLTTLYYALCLWAVCVGCIRIVETLQRCTSLPNSISAMSLHSSKSLMVGVFTLWKSALVILFRWLSRLKQVVGKMLIMQINLQSVCVLSVAVALWTAQNVEAIFYPYLKAIISFSKEVTPIIVEWVKFWQLSLLVHFCITH